MCVYPLHVIYKEGLLVKHNLRPSARLRTATFFCILFLCALLNNPTCLRADEWLNADFEKHAVLVEYFHQSHRRVFAVLFFQEFLRVMIIEI